ncbi:hypothetical protein AGMMS50256_14330 [Betaproteobacteria bacterium]|nr:hypothetical protein AGMMS50256_14330 [Betaproteobacteria bacterium]
MRRFAAFPTYGRAPYSTHMRSEIPLYPHHSVIPAKARYRTNSATATRVLRERFKNQSCLFFIMIFTLIKWLYVAVNAYLIVRLYRILPGKGTARVMRILSCLFIKVIPQLTN